jgi:hypothetical protein
MCRCCRCGSQRHGFGVTHFCNLNLARVNSRYSTRYFTFIAIDILVAGVFEREVFALLQRDHFLTKAPTPDIRKDQKWENYHSVALARYVLRKPYEANTAPHEHFPALINALVDKVMELEAIDQNTEHVRQRYILTLCCTARKPVIFGHYKKAPQSDSSLLDHVLVAGIYLGRRVVVEKQLHLLDMNATRDSRPATSEFWGQPLLAAIRVENVSLVCRLLDMGIEHNLKDSEYGKSCLRAVVRTKRAKEILSLFRWHQNGFLRHESEFRAAICCYATEVGSLDVTNMVLDFFQANCAGLIPPPYPFGSDMEEALRNACVRGFDDVVIRLLDLGQNVNPDRSIYGQERDLAYLACAAGQASTLDILIKRGARIGWSVEENELITVAVKAGHTKILRTLLDAGEVLRPLQAYRLLDYVAPRPESTECIWYLLHRGGINIKDLIKVTRARRLPFAHIVVSAAIYGNICFIEALARFGVPIDDNDALFYTEQDCVPPIVAATAFRQTAMLEALKELGAEEVDPMKSIIARHFRSGLFPCDPPRPEDIGRR